MAGKEIRAIHANDPEWIIALWLAIHGGDPATTGQTQVSQQKVGAAATNIIRELAAHLDPAKQKAVVAALGH